MDTKNNAAQGSSLVVDFNDLNTPGAYVDQNGRLYRVPAKALTEGHSPDINIVSDEEISLTMISDNPLVPIDKARELTANTSGLVVNF